MILFVRIWVSTELWCSTMRPLNSRIRQACSTSLARRMVLILDEVVIWAGVIMEQRVLFVALVTSFFGFEALWSHFLIWSILLHNWPYVREPFLAWKNRVGRVFSKATNEVLNTVFRSYFESIILRVCPPHKLPAAVAIRWLELFSHYFCEEFCLSTLFDERNLHGQLSNFLFMFEIR